MSLDKGFFLKCYHRPSGHSQLEGRGETCCGELQREGAFPPVELMEMQVNSGFKNLEGVKTGDVRRIYVGMGDLMF